MAHSTFHARRPALLAVRSLSGYTGLTGTLTNDGTGNLAAASPIFMIVENGEWVEATGMPSTGEFTCDDEWGCSRSPPASPSRSPTSAP